MTTIEIQDFVHIYSVFSFRDGSKIPGIVVHKYNHATMQIDFYFIAHPNMHAYKSAFEKYDRETCKQLSKRINSDEVLNIRPVSLSDYKMIMELMDERQQLINMHR